MLRILLIILVVNAELSLCFQYKQTVSPSVSDGFQYKQPVSPSVSDSFQYKQAVSPSVSDSFRHRLFSTYSPKAWSRSNKIWHQDAGHKIWHQDAGSGRLNAYNDTITVSLRDYRGEDDAEDGQFVCFSVENATLSDSVELLLYGCEGAGNSFVRVALLASWILVLFYLLGTTASDYFSCTMEKLSATLKLSPAVAGVTLLAIGNGAPDVFSSVAAFVSSDRAGSIGFGCVLGGALFITTVVSGTVALVTARICNKAGYKRISLVCFVRDALFLLASAGVLVVIILDGKVYLWEAISFLCVYVVYAASVWAAEMLENRHRGASSVLDPLLSKGTDQSCLLPKWSNLQRRDHLYHMHSQDLEVELEYYLKSCRQHVAITKCRDFALFLYKYGVDWPLSVPRRLTIPIIEEDRWSRPLAVISCTLAPLLNGGLYVIESKSSRESMQVTFGISGGIGICLGLMAFLNTENTRPPCRCLWVWLAGGFVMSIVWFYIVANQLVQALETLGFIFNINPTILGLTVLAWGNSIGDLVADLALAFSGRDGVQIAISGCYAGPLFNTVVGLGLSLIVACMRAYPEPLFIVDEDGSLFFIIGFLGAGLAWALIMMPLKGMQLSRSFGAGLVLVYCGFLVTGMCYGMGWILH